MIMKNKVFGVLCCSFLFSVSMYAQEPLSPELSKQVEQIAATIKNNPDAAAESFDELAKGKNKKNISLLVAIGNAYLKEGKNAEAKEYADRAMKVDSKSATTCMFAGDVALAEKNVGTACGYYEQAILFDADCFEAYYKYARAYIGVNPQLSVDKLLELKAKHPEEINVDRELAVAYYQMGNYSQAKQAYDEFMQKGQPEKSDYGRYAMLLYLNKNYDQSLDMANKGIEVDPNSHLLKRLRMYNLSELKSYDEGLAAADKFFEDPNNPDYVYLDFLYRARLYVAHGDNDLAMAEFDKAMKADKDKEHPEIAKEASEANEKVQNYPEAIRWFMVYLDGLKGKEEVTDLFLLGRLNYMAAGSMVASVDSLKTDQVIAAVDTIQKKAYLFEADTIFAQVSERVPDNYMGYFWRARTNAMLDPETTQGLAKPYYEKALSILEANPNASKSLLIECQSYLAYYYIQIKDFEQSKIYWNKNLAIDPENATAKQALDWIKTLQ